MKYDVSEIVSLIQEGVSNIPIVGKVGQRLLLPRIAQVLTAAGYDVDTEDKLGFFPPAHSAWRDKSTGSVVATSGRRRIDLVVRNAGSLVALVEVESDLNDLRDDGVSGRSGHYDVFSVARRADGAWFDSYKSLERMAAAVWYATGHSQAALEALASDSRQDHNPLGIGLILVTGSSRASDRRILDPRLHALGACLISLVTRG